MVELILTGGMTEYPGIIMNEWNLGKFLDPVEFQSWKCNFRTGVCERIADLRSPCSGSEKLRLLNQLMNL